MGFLESLAQTDIVVREILGGFAVYAPGSGSPVTVACVFSVPHVQVDTLGTGVSSSGPTVFLRLEDLPSDPSIDDSATVTVDGTTYKSWDVNPDGLGGVFLKLHKV